MPHIRRGLLRGQSKDSRPVAWPAMGPWLTPWAHPRCDL